MKREKFACDKCIYKNYSKPQVRNHKIRVHGICGKGERTKVKCNICDYKAVNSADRRKHYKKEHPGENVFKCDYCEYGSFGLAI